MDQESKNDGLINFDFLHVFPHVFWVSNWSVDETYPLGICYKILSVRNELLNRGEFVLLRAFPNGDKEILQRGNVPFGELENAMKLFVDGLSEKLGLDFERQDYQTAKSLDDFHGLTDKHGWHMKKPRK